MKKRSKIAAGAGAALAVEKGGAIDVGGLLLGVSRLVLAGLLGACIGTDAHTVGIDAILNVKGFAGEKGLEYYRELKVVNLGAQVSVPQLVDRARAAKAALNGIDPIDVNKSYRFEQGFTFELNLSGVQSGPDFEIHGGGLDLVSNTTEGAWPIVLHLDHGLAVAANQVARADVAGQPHRLAVEAGVTLGWERYVGERGAIIGMDRKRIVSARGRPS
jgi:hypothetical protein